MFTFFVALVCVAKAQSHVLPLIYAAPSAVSHQSRIDIKHSPGFISTPLVYNPIAIVKNDVKEIPRETVLTPILDTSAVLTPVALSFFHNLPLARALEHPISIDVDQNSYKKEDENVVDKKPEEVSTEKAILVKQVNQKEVGTKVPIEIVANEPQNNIMSSKEQLM